MPITHLVWNHHIEGSLWMVVVEFGIWSKAAQQCVTSTLAGGTSSIKRAMWTPHAGPRSHGTPSPGPSGTKLALNHSRSWAVHASKEGMYTSRPVPCTSSKPDQLCARRDPENAAPIGQLQNGSRGRCVQYCGSARQLGGIVWRVGTSLQVTPSMVGPIGPSRLAT